MRTVFWILSLLLLTLPGWAKDSESQAKTRFRGWLKSMAQIEAKVKPIEPIHIAAEKRTPADNKEVMKRIEFLDNINAREVPALGKEINNYRDTPDTLSIPFQTVRDAQEALGKWTSVKLTLQNAGVNNPGLESLRKQEPQSYADYRKAYQSAEAACK